MTARGAGGAAPTGAARSTGALSRPETPKADRDASPAGDAPKDSAASTGQSNDPGECL